MDTSETPRINIYFSVDDMVEVVESRKPSDYLFSLYFDSHLSPSCWSIVEAVNARMEAVIEAARRGEKFPKKLFTRPRDEETALLETYSGYLRLFVGDYTERLKLPTEIETDLRKIRKVPSSYERALREPTPMNVAKDWLESHPEKDLPVKVGWELRRELELIHTNAVNLAEFYNTKKPLRPLTDKLFDPGVEKISDLFFSDLERFQFDIYTFNHREALPWLIFAEFYDLFAAKSHGDLPRDKTYNEGLKRLFSIQNL